MFCILFKLIGNLSFLFLLPFLFVSSIFFTYFLDFFHLKFIYIFSEFCMGQGF